MLPIDEIELYRSYRRPLSPGIPVSASWRKVTVSANSLPPANLGAMLEWSEKNCQGRYSHGSVMDYRSSRNDYAFWFRNKQDHTAFALIWGTW
jgi:hypothetical protein